MYIPPNSLLYLFKNIPLTSAYEDTFYFPNKNAQYQYFVSQQDKFAFYSQSYIRYGRGRIRLNIQEGHTWADYINCTYMMYKNSDFEGEREGEGFENKWFYAFVDRVEYVNNATFDVYFTLDVIQTWGVGVDISGFIIRETVADDRWAVNLEPEPIGGGELTEQILEGAETRNPIYGWGNTWKPVAFCNTETMLPIVEKLIVATPKYVGNLILQQRIKVIDDFQDFVDTVGLLDYEEQVSAVMMLPVRQIPGTNNYDNALGMNEVREGVYSNGDLVYNLSGNASTSEREWINILPSTSFYKNKKLYTYPYCCFSITTPTTSQDYAYEKFAHLVGEFPTIRFKRYADLSLSPSVTLVPYGYNEYDPTGNFAIPIVDENLSYSVSVTNFPLCQWATTDAWRNILEFAGSTAISAIGAIGVPAIKGAALAFGATGFGIDVAGNPITNFNTANNMWNATSESADLAARLKKYGAQPTYPFRSQLFGDPQITALERNEQSNDVLWYLNEKANDFVKETISNFKPIDSSVTMIPAYGNISYQSNGFKFILKQRTISSDRAKVLDDYFSKYGYARNRIGEVDPTARDEWYYVKMGEAHIKGSIPNEYKVALMRIHQNGIRYWRNPANFGDYTKDNKPRVS